MINIFKYIFLGFVQGFTETIPVSSSGHLMIFKTLMNVDIDFDTLAILTNFGSLVAILILFRKDIIELITGFFKYLNTKEKKYKSEYKYCFLIVLGCIPAGLVGVIVSKLDLFAKIEDNVKVVGLSLIVTAILLFLIRNFKGKKNDKNLGVRDALTVGVFQILGLFPGISRSGSTIVGGMFSNLKRDTAFKYSFMLYIPISLAAMVLEVTDLKIDKDLVLHYFLSVLVAGIVTFLVTKWFRKIVNEGKLIYFSAYCFIVGLLVVIFL